jgi:hypothetical protein
MQKAVFSHGGSAFCIQKVVLTYIKSAFRTQKTILSTDISAFCTRKRHLFNCRKRFPATENGIISLIMLILRLKSKENFRRTQNPCSAQALP